MSDPGPPNGAATPVAGPNSEAGPLGKVDPASPSTPGAVLRPPLGLATMTVVVGFVALIASLVVLGSIAGAVRAQEVFALDTWATPFLHGIASPGLDALMDALTTLGSSQVIIPAFVIVVAGLLWKRRPGAALFLAIASGGSLVLDGTMKVFFQRPRPDLPWAQILNDYSFPSGHTMNSLVFYVGLALILWSVSGPPDRPGRPGHRLGAGVRRRGEPDLPRLPLPHGRRGRAPGGYCVAARGRCGIPRPPDLAAMARCRSATGRQPRRSWQGGGPMTRALVIGRRRKGREIEETVRETRRLLEAAGRVSVRPDALTVIIPAT